MLIEYCSVTSVHAVSAFRSLLFNADIKRIPTAGHSLCFNAEL